MTNYDDSFFDDGRQYFAHGLPAWKRFVIEDLRAESLADFGCGQGDWLEPLQDTIPVWGCDGYADVNSLRIHPSNFRTVDISTVDPKTLDVGSRDVCMSLEAMEHVIAEKESNFLDCMLSPDPRLVVFSVASGWGTYDASQPLRVTRAGETIPGGPGWHPQWGRHHVNCQPVECVIEKMRKRGYIVDEALTSTFANLRVPSTRSNRKGTRMAFASFYRKNTRVYKKS
jgi:hypothetical protein